MSKLQRYYRKLMNAHNRSLLMMDLACIAILIIFLLPLFNYAFGLSLKLWGQSYLTYENALSYITYPTTILLLLIVLSTLSLWILFRQVALIHCINCENAEMKPGLLYLLQISLRKTLRSLRPCNLVLPLFSVLQILLTNLPLLIAIVLSVDLHDFSGSYSELFIRCLMLLFLLLLSFMAFRGIFALHYCTNEHQCFLSALEQSKGLLKGRQIRTFMILMLYNLALAIISYVIYYILFTFVAFFVFLFTEKSMVITVFLSVYNEISMMAVLFYHMVALITNFNLINSLFTRYRDEDIGNSSSYVIPTEQPPLPRKRKHFARKGFLAFVVVAGLFNFYLTVRNDAFILEDALSGIRISSHRGNSHLAPENTLPAIEYAIAAHSDYCEIDIRQTKDGIIILLHDESLLRTAGLNRNIHTLLYEEISGLDVGSWFGLEYNRARIPTLEEVLILSKGEIKLNIEVKPKHADSGLEERLVSLIEQYDFQYQCLISSTDYNILKRIKELNPELKTGLIIAAAFGDFYHKEELDFLSIRSKYITRNVVESAHRAGKEVHAWTVNSPKEIERMKSLGVDCIITDNPIKTREILMQDDRNRSFIELLRRLLKSHSFASFLPG